jgi:hypothetical protein
MIGFPLFGSSRGGVRDATSFIEGDVEAEDGDLNTT